MSSENDQYRLLINQLDGVRGALVDLAISIGDLPSVNIAEEAVKQQKQLTRLGRFIVAIMALVVFMAGAAVWEGFQERQRDHRDDTIRQTTLDISRQLKDCLDPTGKCYQDNQVKQGQVIELLVRKLGCVLLVEPPNREQADVDRCLKSG